MGDLINNMEVFKKLDFDSSNQWIFYDERFHRFFDFFANNISDVNILTEHEVLERNELVTRQQYLDTNERRVRLQELEQENPGLLKYSEAELAALGQNITLLEETNEAYTHLVEDMLNTKRELNSELSQEEERINLLLNTEKELLASCQSKSKKLESLQRENCKLSLEATKSFTKIQSPALFMHQLPLEQYCLKCDSFMQYFTLYMKENFKIQDYIELDTSLTDSHDVACKLEKLGKSIEHYTLAYIIEKAKAHATQSVVEALDLTQIHVISLDDMEREIHELTLVNSHQEIAHKTLMNDLHVHVQQRARQRLELTLYENTKQKLERALRRHENDKRLAKIISDALSNAELIWMTIQLDLEKKRNRFDNSAQLSAEAQTCWQRVQNMRSQSTSNAVATFGEFIGQLGQQLTQHLGQQVRCEAKMCLYEYEKLTRLLNYALQGMLNGKPYASTLEKLKEINRLESVLRPFVYDSPVNAPMFENVRYLQPIFNVRTQQQHIEKQLRQLRKQFHANITERMEKDKLWRYSQLLWIWFLTEPRRLLVAIEEVKKAAAKVPSMTGLKSLGGIKRK